MAGLYLSWTQVFKEPLGVAKWTTLLLHLSDERIDKAVSLVWPCHGHCISSLSSHAS